jgi:hypothetical protein
VRWNIPEDEEERWTTFVDVSVGWENDDIDSKENKNKSITTMNEGRPKPSGFIVNYIRQEASLVFTWSYGGRSKRRYHDDHVVTSGIANRSKRRRERWTGDDRKQRCVLMERFLVT